MFKLIANTLGTKIIIVLTNVFIVVMASQKLGAVAMGDISMIILSVTIFLQINNIIGGPALVYLVPRHESGSILLLSYGWAIITTLIGGTAIYLLQLVPNIYFWHVLALSFIFAVTNIHLTILLAKEKINTFNILLTVNVLILLIALSVFIFVFKQKNVFAYIHGMYCAYGLSFIAAMILMLYHLGKIKFESMSKVYKDLMKYGSIMQLANILQLLNYRMNYYLIDHFWGKATLGIYAVGNQVSEGVWLISQSMGTVLYPKISNTNDNQYSAKLTLFFMKISGVVTLFLIVILLFLPTTFYTYIFGTEFIQVKTVILSLSIGVFFLAMTKIFANFFSGTGKPQINTISSALGLFIVTISGLILIPRWGFVGAGITASVTYFSSFVFLLIMFVNKTEMSLKSFAINRHDIILVKQEIKKFFNHV